VENQFEQQLEAAQRRIAELEEEKKKGAHQLKDVQRRVHKLEEGLETIRRIERERRRHEVQQLRW
jgi:hypothetical protein